MITPAVTDAVYYFSIKVPYSQCGALYDASQSSVILTDDHGLRIQVPASRMRAFVSSTGISGRFRLIVDKNRKIKAFERVS